MRAATWLIEVSGRPIPGSISYDLTVRASTDEHAAMMFSGLAYHPGSIRHGGGDWRRRRRHMGLQVGDRVMRRARPHVPECRPAAETRRVIRGETVYDYRGTPRYLM